ncbi:uncharacterized protein LOC143233613 [Tachypleus tridentatus]|uniref:uncharacterized protein LOC143233613 n=1 Tax=Tachypleus tridentatus TaxID=6853 RepID=UPI003FD25289
MFSFCVFYNQPHTYSFLASHASSATLSASLPHYEFGRQMALLNSTAGGAFYPISSVKTNLTGSSVNTDVKDGHTNNSKCKEPKLFQWSQYLPIDKSQKVLDLRSPEAVGRDHSNKSTRVSLSPGNDFELSSKIAKIQESNELQFTRWRTLSNGQSYCPVCGVTLQSQDLMEHVQQEIENLHEFYRSKEWDSLKEESDKTVVPDLDCSLLKQCGTSRVGDRRPPIARWETYLRVRSNRHIRVNARHMKLRRRTPDFSQQEVAEHKVFMTFTHNLVLVVVLFHETNKWNVKNKRKDSKVFSEDLSDATLNRQQGNLLYEY